VQGSDGSFYGTTENGGNFGYTPPPQLPGWPVLVTFGTVFKISTNGALTTLYYFTGGNDGSSPTAGLVQGSDGDFYGTTSGRGTNGGYGTVFKMSTNGALTRLYSFTDGNRGANSVAGLVQGSDG
jgi:uncharacterized repeat protein (TIGR03803 family)